jgi:hypothetical protein
MAELGAHACSSSWMAVAAWSPPWRMDREQGRLFGSGESPRAASQPADGLCFQRERQRTRELRRGGGGGGWHPGGGAARSAQGTGCRGRGRERWQEGRGSRFGQDGWVARACFCFLVLLILS